MRLRDTIICSLCIVLAAALLMTAGMQLDFINSQREDMHLIIDKPENVPPSLAFTTIATGAFRGLVVDVLWMRADRLKEQGQFFDAKQLAEWITTLQPRFASVWEFHAWNMAYNISVAIPATQPDQRWQWVKNGYELLRDRGIEWNPKSIQLYRELARIFQHKIGALSDDAHKYYKLQLALAMEPLLGSADDQYFDALAQTPTDWEQIIKDADVALLITALKSADDTFADDDEFVSNYLSLRQNPRRFKPAAFDVIDDFRVRGPKSLKKFDTFAKAYKLRNTWKLDPVLMRELNKTYGPIDFRDPNFGDPNKPSKHFPLDWRHADSHAIYWAVKGLHTAAEEESREVGMAEINTDRIVGHSLQNLFRNGKIFIYNLPTEESSDPSSQTPVTPVKAAAQRKAIFLRPDLRMFEPCNEARLATLEKYKDLEKRIYDSYQDGHRNMLKNAVLSFYQAGHRSQAQKIYNQLRKLYPLDEFKVPDVVVYARNRLREELRNINVNDAKEIILMMLQEAYFRYAMRDDDEAAGLEKMAKDTYDLYNKEIDPEERIALPDFKLLRYLALVAFMNDRLYPPNVGRNLLGRIKIERPDLYEQLIQRERQEEEQLKKIK
jgi:hypothetical protein